MWHQPVGVYPVVMYCCVYCEDGSINVVHFGGAMGHKFARFEVASFVLWMNDLDVILVRLAKYYSFNYFPDRGRIISASRISLHRIESDNLKLGKTQLIWRRAVFIIFMVVTLVAGLVIRSSTYDEILHNSLCQYNTTGTEEPVSAATHFWHHNAGWSEQ